MIKLFFITTQKFNFKLRKYNRTKCSFYFESEFI